VGGDGPGRGWRYQDPRGTAGGVRRIVLRPGLVTVTAGGRRWPCDLAADVQRLPVSVVLRIAETRYCAALGAGAVRRNAKRRLTAERAPAPAACPATSVSAADLNVLHGVTCPPGTASCRLEERVDLLFRWIAASGCPDVVTLQEVSTQVLPLVTARLARPCSFAYQAVSVQGSTFDNEVILTRYPAPIVESEVLFGDFRHLLFARIDHPLGPLDVFTTHLAASTDGATDACTAPDCPSECAAAGAATRRDCQAVQVAALVAERHTLPTPALVSGDFNEPPNSFVYRHLVGRGWRDTYLDAGNPECDPATGVGCTSGREDRQLDQLESPALNESERIDFIFLVPGGASAPCTPTIEPAGDPDGDGARTALFADAPNPFAPGCGPAPAAVCWPSDHVGTQLDGACQ
jgi:endonuclease/exonuclease/phosphatase family metal-dependent hydrolase